MKRSQRRWLGVGVSAVVLALVIYHFSRNGEWRQFQWDLLWSLLVHAHPGWLIAAVVASYSTYVLRALRWKFFLDPIKQASLWVLFAGQVLGFSSIYLIGRPGEVVRPAYIARRESVSFSSQLAVWLLERIYDSVSVIVLFGVALYFEPIHPTSIHAARALRRMHEGASAVLILTLLTIVALVLFRLYSDAVIPWLAQTFRFLPARVRSYLGRFLRSFADGLEVIRNWRDLLASLVCTVALWLANVSIFWLVFRSLGGAVAGLSWWEAALALFFAAVGLMVQLPGVGGGYQVGTMLALKHVFHLPAEASTSAGILVWIIVLVPCLALGAALLVYEGLTFRKLEAITEEGRAAAVEKA